jgi:hypothetical protein
VHPLVPAVWLRRNRQQTDRAGHPLNHLPFYCLLQHHVQHREHVVDGLRCAIRQSRFELLHVFGGDRSSNTVPNAASKCTRATIAFDAVPLGFC